MSEYDNDIAIMFSADWPDGQYSDEDIDSHCTLIYLGEISEASFTKEDIQSVLDRLKIRAPGGIEPTGLDLFGEEENVLVATLATDKLKLIRESLDRALAKVGAENASEYKEYKPHVTISYKFDGTLEDAKKDIKLPEKIVLSAPELWWGDEH